MDIETYELIMDIVFIGGLIVIVIGVVHSFRTMWINRRKYY